MAITNIMKEPRRELIESALGYLAVVPLVLYWVLFGLYLYHHPGTQWDGGDRVMLPIVLPPALPVVGVLTLIALYGALVVFPHFIGEKVSAALAERGWDPRPEIRWRDGHPHAIVDGWDYRMDMDRSGQPITDIAPEVVLARYKAHQNPRTGEPLPPVAPPPPMTLDQYDAYRFAQQQMLTNVPMGSLSLSGGSLGAYAPGTVVELKS